MCHSHKFLWLVCVSPAALWAQTFTFSFTAGTNLTNHFPRFVLFTPADRFGNPDFLFRHESGNRSLILGGTVEAGFAGRFAFETGVLHRPMNAVLTSVISPNGELPIRIEDRFTAVRAWQFPVLLKYYLPDVRGARPFLAGGMSFRTQEDASAAEPSQSGFTIGAGAVFAWNRLRVSPTLRYTRWAREDIYPRYPTKWDQLELLTGFGFSREPAPHAASSWRIRFGVIAGIPLTRGFEDHLSNMNPGLWGSERFGYAAGLGLISPLRGRWSLEANGLYRPLRAKGRNPDRRTEFSVLTWQIPVLIRHTWDRPGWKPFVAAGPSFRLSGNLNGAEPSKRGVTAGGGLEKQLGGRAWVAPSFRYTRWQRDRPWLATNPNSAEVHVALFF